MSQYTNVKDYISEGRKKKSCNMLIKLEELWAFVSAMNIWAVMVF